MLLMDNLFNTGIVHIFFSMKCHFIVNGLVSYIIN